MGGATSVSLLNGHVAHPSTLMTAIPFISRGQVTQRPITHQLFNMKRITDYRNSAFGGTSLYRLQGIWIKRGCVAGESFALPLHGANKAF